MVTVEERLRARDERLEKALANLAAALDTFHDKARRLSQEFQAVTTVVKMTSPSHYP